MNNKYKYVLATADFCEPCKAVKAKIQRENLDIDVKDSEGDRQFFVDNNIRSVPVLLVFDDIDNLVEKIVGSKEILDKINEG